MPWDPASLATQPLTPPSSFPMLLSSLTPIAAFAGAVLLFAVPAPIPESGALEGITVEGVGRADVRANRIEVRARVTSTEGVAADAFDGYVELKRRALEGLASAGIEGLEVRGLGATLSYFEGQDPEIVANPMVFNGGQTMDTSPNVRYREVFVISRTGADSLDDEALAKAVAEILDAAVDNGMQLESAGAGPQAMWWAVGPNQAKAPPTLVTFRLDDPAEVERAAYSNALNQARRRAQSLAELSGATLGSVYSIEVLETTEQWATATTVNTCQARLRVTYGLQ
jgi:uncharacterized protein DUF541